MIFFHTVTEGDTLVSLAKQYNMPLQRLMLENGYDDYQDLNIGQIVNVSEAEKVYQVQRGDTIEKIVNEQNISLMELLKNNPQLSENMMLRIGEQLVIDYGVKESDIEVNGICFSFIPSSVLRSTLPYLTYLTVMEYRVDMDGEIEDIDDEYILMACNAYGVVPFMLVSTQNETGVGSYDITNELFNNLTLQIRLIERIIDKAKVKGYHGVVFGFQFLLDNDVGNYKNFIDYATFRLHEEGLLSWEMVIPKFLYNREEPNRLQVTENIDGAILMSYQWANNYVPNLVQSSYNYNRATLEILLASVDAKKVSLGISRIAYDGELPYVPGESFVSTLTDPRAMALASQMNALIEYDDETRHPYFRYMLNDIEHEVRFKDARYRVAMLDLAMEFGLGGVSIWNIMYFSRLWFTFNIMTNIVKHLPFHEDDILSMMYRGKEEDRKDK